MYTFITKGLGYSLLLLIILEIFCGVLIKNIPLSYKLGIDNTFLGQQAIYNRSNQKFQSDTLIIGGSVSRQIFKGESNMYTSHAGILMQGNFVILKNVLRANPQVKVVLFGISPMTLSFGFHEKGTSLNYIKPYQSIYNFRDLDMHSLSHMSLKPLSFLYLFNFGKFLPLSDIDFTIDPPYRKNFNKDAFIYLDLMKKFCKSKGVEFTIFCPPIDQRRIDVTNDFQEVRGRVYQSQLEPLFDRYFKTVMVLDDSYFRDGQHFHNHIINKERDKISALIFNKIKESKN